LSNRIHESLRPHLKQLPVLFKNRSLLKLNFGIFSQHAILTANFVIVPLLLNSLMPNNHPSPLFYLVIVACAFAVAIPIIIYTHRTKKAHILLPIMIGVLALSQLLFVFFHGQLWSIAANLILFFIAFNVLEAELPAQISTIAPQAQKGAAMGIYSSCQFLGIFCGGAVGGFLYGHVGSTPVFMLGLGLALIWFTLSFAQKKRPVVENEGAVGA
jgi:predicted MFS family arabinose efflux permease